MDSLFARSHMVLGGSQETMGRLVGVSKRTVSRWYALGTNLTVANVCTLARLVFPEDPKLAAELAYEANETLESLGLVAPPPPAPPPPPPLPNALLVDAVVCAAADALQAAPSTVRAALFAAFRRARELRLGLEDVEGALAPAQVGKAASGGGKKSQG